MALAASITLAVPANALVLCRKRSGVVVARDSCKKKESSLNLADFGAVGPPGPQGPPGVGPLTQCPPDSVRVGHTCVDKYEASVWQIPVANTALITSVQEGRATLEDLNAGGAVQLGAAGQLNCPSGLFDFFPDDGQWPPAPGSVPRSPGVYAASVAGVLPSTCFTWLQAAQACVLSGKHLAANREWQDAVTGTPDGAPCVVSGAPANTGANPGCVSSFGAFDMVGNVWEYVADWVPSSTNCPGWGSFSDDLNCLAGASTTASPGVISRGGGYYNLEEPPSAAGPLAVLASEPLANAQYRYIVGFRCAR